MIVLIESPYKVKSLKKALRLNGIEADVIASNGRLFDLPDNNVGISESLSIDSFEPVNPALFESIQAHLESHDDLYIATDPDDEGDLAAWTIARYRQSLPTYRVTLYDFTSVAVKVAFEGASSVSMVEPAALARRIFDRLLGYSGNDGMFLSRTAGAVLQLAANQAIPIKKVVNTMWDADGACFNERYSNGQGAVVMPTLKPATGPLPQYSHCLGVGCEMGETPKSVFAALQELYTDGDISYFRTSSGETNRSAISAMNAVERDVGLDNLASVDTGLDRHPHPGIYVTDGAASDIKSKRQTPLAKRFHQLLLNSTLCAMAGRDDCRQVRKTEAGSTWSAQHYTVRGQTFSYPLSTHALGDDVMTGSPREWPHDRAFTIPKEGGIAMALIGSGVGHPSSWASLSQNYACLIDKNGNLSVRGSDFYRKHQLEAPALLSPENARTIESILLNPNKPTAEKVLSALDYCGLSLGDLNLKLSPDRGRTLSFSGPTP